MATDNLVDRFLQIWSKLDKVTAQMYSFSYNKKIDKLDLIAISVIHRGKEITMTEFAKELDIGKSYATSVIDRLIENNLVKRITNDEDRRQVKIKLTRKGNNLAVENYIHIQAVFRKILNVLAPEEQELVISALEKITYSLADTSTKK